MTILPLCSLKVDDESVCPLFLSTVVSDITEDDRLKTEGLLWWAPASCYNYLYCMNSQHHYTFECTFKCKLLRQNSNMILPHYI